jgi:hypothetical protein
MFNKKITLRSYLRTIEAKAFSSFIRTYSQFESERLSDNIKLTHHKALIRSIMAYAADAHLLKLQCLQNRVLHTIGNFSVR